MEHVDNAKRKLLSYLHQFPGFLGLDVSHPKPGHSLICIRWLENIEIPPIPAVVHNVQIVIVPTALHAAEYDDPTISGSWLSIAAALPLIPP